MFRFKQFSVDQSGCAMKVNTDGVLLGALCGADDPDKILDIGTGTGVIALMLAQRFPSAHIDAVEIDGTAAATAGKNFENSPFAESLSLFPLSFEQYFDNCPDKTYELVVSNPPFHLNSLKSPKAGTTLAKHAGESFFEGLLAGVSGHLTVNGVFWLVLPPRAGGLVKALASRHKLYLQKQIDIHSFAGDKPNREILCFGWGSKKLITEEFVMYHEPKVYSEQYRNSLKNFLIIF